MTFANFKASLTVVSLLGITFVASTSTAGTIGTPGSVGFQGTVATFCTINTTSGTLGVKTDRLILTTNMNESGDFIGSRQAGSITVSSNIPAGGYVIIDSPTLSGVTSAGTSQVMTGASWQSSTTIPITNGTAYAPLDVKFTNTSSNKFANGIYNATVTATCTDDGNK